MDRAQKEQLVASLRESVGDVALLVVTQQSGLSVAEATDLRRQMRQAGANFRVTKNRLARLALKDTKFGQIVPLFTGPTAIATSKDPVAAAKVAVEFADKNDKLTIIGGALDDKVGVMAMLEAVEALLPKLLVPGGDLALKILEGPEAQQVDRRIRQSFERAKTAKSSATRKGSSERYLVARGYRRPDAR